MRKILGFAIFSLIVISFSYARGEGEAYSNMKPGNLSINNEASICYQVSPNNYVYGNQIEVKWTQPPSSDWFDKDLFEWHVYPNSYYLYVKNKVTGETKINYYSIGPKDNTHFLLDLSNISESGFYNISVGTNCEKYIVIMFEEKSAGWWTSDASTISVIIDHSPPLKPEFPPGVLNGTNIGGILYTNENSTGVNESTGNVTVTIHAAKDDGPQENNGASGVAGYKIYEELSSGDILLASILGNDPTDTLIPLSEGVHKIKYAGFDNITLLENEGNIENVTMGVMSNPVTIIVDRSGPEPVTINTGNMLSLPGKDHPFVINNTGINWNVPQDLPNISEDQINHFIGTSKYRVSITNVTSGSTTNYDPQSETTFIIPNGFETGLYSISIQPIDGLGNTGQVNDPVIFCVDKLPPPAKEPDSFSIDDASAQIITGAGVVTINTSQKNCVVSFAAVSDGTDEFASGLKGYRLYRENGAIEELATNSLSFSGLASGENRFTLTAIDRVGNESAPVSLILVLPTLQPVTFPTPCYYLDSDVYHLKWNIPLNEGGPAIISYYKVIVQNATEPAPSYQAFSAAGQITGLECALVDAAQGVELAAYVLAVTPDGSWSIGSKEFTLPPLNVSGDEPRILTGDEYWGPGTYDLNQSVIVPAGITLHILDDTTIRVHGSGGIFIRIYGTLDAAGADTGVTFVSGKTSPTKKDWKGIIANGVVHLENTTLKNAERGLSALNGSSVEITGSAFINCRVGIHAGTQLLVTSTRFESCEWYAVKEDAIVDNKRPVLVNCIFKGNGGLYYHMENLILNLSQLNGLDGNSGNQEQ